LKNNSSGQVTVFLAITLLSVLMLAGLLVDLSRMSAGRALVKRAADSASMSVLAKYNSRLKQDYGIFAIPAASEEELNSCFEEYLAANLSIPSEDDHFKRGVDLFDFRIEKVKITPILNLSENEVTKRQILEFMKYRAPVELTEGFIERLSSVKDLGKMSDAYKKKVGIDKILGSMDKAQQKLKKSIDGIGDSVEKFINGFNQEGSWEAAYNIYNSLCESAGFKINELSSVDESIRKLQEMRAHYENLASQGGEGSDKDVSIEALKDIDQSLSSLWNERYKIEKEYAGLKDEIRGKWDEIRNSMTEDYKKANENAIKEIQKIIEKGEKAKIAIAELEEYLSKNFGDDEGEISKGFKEQTQDELDALKKLILDGERAREILQGITENTMVLDNVINIMDGVRPDTGTEGEVPAFLPHDLIEIIKDYTKIRYDYEKPEKGEEKDDPRKGKADAAKRIISEKLLKDINYLNEGIKNEDLPSHTKISSDSVLSGAEYEGNLENVADDADLYDEEGCFQENALGFIADIGRNISEDAAALRDNIYINEYIMGMFKTSVPNIVTDEGTAAAKNLHGIDKSSLDTFYDSEVEYIINGNPSQLLNNTMTRGRLLLIRFGLNTLHVYTDAKKKAAATSIATAVAGWWTGGAGIPVITNLIMCGWGMGEAVIDLKELLEGESVPLYKLQGDWRLDIGLPGDSGPQLNKALYFNYQDYLRLFLLTMNEEKKLSRIEDLIQLNIGKTKKDFKMSQSNTYVMVEAEVSMGHLFITKPFVRKQIKTPDGRYVFKVVFYEGY